MLDNQYIYDSIRESLSYFGLVSFGNDKNQYFVYYEPKHAVSDKIIVWVQIVAKE